MSSPTPDLDVPAPAFALLLRGLLHSLEGGSTQWEALRAATLSSFPPSEALSFASALQRALARAAFESWAPPALEAFLRSGGIAPARAEAAASAWAAAAPALHEAVALRREARPLISGAPRFVAATTAATSETVSSGGEARALVRISTDDGRGLEFAAGKGELAGVLAQIARLRKTAAAGAEKNN